MDLRARICFQILPWQMEKQLIHSDFFWAQHESWGALIDSYL